MQELTNLEEIETAVNQYGEGPHAKQAEQYRDAGEDQQRHVLFDAPQLQQVFQFFHESFHVRHSFYHTGYRYSIPLWVLLVKKKAASKGCFSSHIGEALHRLGKALNGLVRVPVLDAVPHAVLDMPLQHHLAAPVEGGLGRVDLGQDVLTGDVLVDHPVDGLHLSDNLLQPAVQVVRVHTLSHCHSLPHHSG